MKKNLAVKLSQISKKYYLHHDKPTLIESIFSRKEEFWALSNINLEIKTGSKIGIIGPNGAGKSTLLKIITGIATPTKGKVNTQGKIASLIDVEAGFHPDLSGKDNIYLNGLLLGMSKYALDEKFNKIVNFSGIGKFVNAPLHTYSSGMKLRLGFSVAVFSDPDILIIDEIISAGDEEFQRKSFQKMKSFFKDDKTIIFASHNLAEIKQLCPITVYISRGQIKSKGQTKKVITNYLNNQS